MKKLIRKSVSKFPLKLQNLFPIINEQFTNLKLQSKSTWDSINQGIDSSNLKIQSFDKKFEEASKSVQFSQQAMQGVLTTLAGQISNAFSGGTASLKEFSNQILSILGDLLIQAGTFAIITSELMKNAFIPGLGVVLGLAAIAVGAALKGLANKVNNEGITAFAKGGIISGPTVGLLGEYAGARHNPEVVAPLNKLKSMIGDRGSTNLNGEFVVRGQDLILALQRAEKSRNRIL